MFNISYPFSESEAKQLTDVEKLYVFCRVWGIVKYHYPDVGSYDLDNEMVSMIPSILKSKDRVSFDETILNWLKKFELKPSFDHQKILKTQIVHKPEYDDIFGVNLISGELESILKEILSLKPNGYYVSYNKLAKVTQFQNEKGFAEMKSFTLPYRLLTLFRYWNAIEYYFPYKNLMDHSWNTVLLKMIPEFIDVKDDTDFVKKIAMLTSYTNDSHANISGDNELVSKYRGKKVVPFNARFIGDTLVVIGYYNDTLEIKNKVLIGDIVESINGTPVNQLVREYLPLIHGSNRVTALKNLAMQRLLRSNAPIVDISVTRNEERIDLKIPTIDIDKLDLMSYFDPNPKKEAFQLIDGEIGYIFPRRYKNKELPALKRDLTNTKGLIVDLRFGAIESMVYTLVPYLKTGNRPFVKNIIPIENYPGYFNIDKEDSVRGSNKYKGKIVVLVNEFTQSHAEFVALAFQASDNVTVMGSTTGGAGGNIVQIDLPGGIKTWFTGNEIVYPDGTQIERNGVRIDTRIKPTLKGIIQGEDEVLEYAKKYILTP